MRISINKHTFNFGDVCLLTCLAVLLSGSSSVRTIYVSFFLFMVWLVSIIPYWNKLSKAVFSNYQGICLGFYLLYITIVGIPVAGYFYTFKQVGAAILAFSGILIAKYIQIRSKQVDTSKLCNCILLIWFLSCIITLYSYNILDINARVIGSGGSEKYDGMQFFAGGYNLAYGCALLIPFLIDMKLSHNYFQTKKGKYIWLLAIAIFSIVVFQTKSTITFTAVLVGLFIVLFYRPLSKNTVNPEITFAVRIVIFFIITAAVFFGISLIGELILWLTQGGTDVLSVRLQSLGYTLAYGESGYATGRMSIPLTSLTTFLDNPILGVAINYGNMFEYSSEFGIGNHCEWPDALGRFGIIGGIPFLLIYYYQVRTVLRQSSGMTLGWVFTFLIMMTFNPFQGNISNFALFVIIPLFINTSHGTEK